VVQKFLDLVFAIFQFEPQTVFEAAVENHSDFCENRSPVFVRNLHWVYFQEIAHGVYSG
jgi:hypothetical protein